MGRSAIYLYNTFCTIIDRAGDPSMEDYEFTQEFNLAALSVFKHRFGNDNLKDSQGNQQFAWEMTDTDAVKWQPLIVKKPTTCDGDGKVLIATIEALLSGKIFHIRFDRKDTNGEYRYCRFVRHNDEGIQIQNDFKKPRELYPVWLAYNEYYELLPARATDVKFTAIKYPSEINLDFANPANNKDTDLTDSVIDEVLWRMASAFGVQIRDQVLTENSLVQEKLQ